MVVKQFQYPLPYVDRRLETSFIFNLLYDSLPRDDIVEEERKNEVDH